MTVNVFEVGDILISPTNSFYRVNKIDEITDEVEIISLNEKRNSMLLPLETFTYSNTHWKGLKFKTN
jgi:GTPase Era involved in 16S rRNA processing